MEATVNVQLNIAAMQGIPARKLQQLLDMLKFARAGSELVTSEAYAASEFFTYEPSQNTRLSLDEVKAASLDWLTLHALRDATEAVSFYLEDVRRFAEIYHLAARGRVRGADFNAVFEGNRAFHKLGLPSKMERLREGFGISSEFDSHLLSLNSARNCVVHRDGVVSALDTNSGDALAITFLRLELAAIGPDGAVHPISGPTVVEADWTINMRSGPETKSFKIGERISLNHEDLRGAMFSLQQYVNSMAAALQSHAEGLGIAFPTPRPLSTTFVPPDA